ncbi:MAG: PepSY domain-containing protein [Rhodoferax sp.]|nr:MAG: PepSY domain-containing protein [Rhodoferax sp.]
MANHLVLWAASALLPLAVHAQSGKEPVAPREPTKPLTSSARDKASEICTQAPRSEWIDAAEMQLLAQHRGYRIKTFKVANGNCYEVYGFDSSNQIVEAYFDPVTTRLVRLNVAR